jgi:hypothetical protein
MTCSTDGKRYYKKLRQEYLSENYHLEEQYVKIIFNCIHKTEFVRTCSGLKLQIMSNKRLRHGPYTFENPSVSKIFWSTGKGGSVLSGLLSLTHAAECNWKWRRHGQLHILWAPTFQAPKQIKHTVAISPYTGKK